jgi:Glycosyl transferases group 1
MSTIEQATSGPGSLQAQDGSPHLWVAIPCLNEADTIEQCVRSALHVLSENNIDGEISVADNDSDDDSARLSAAAGATVVHEPEDRARAASARTSPVTPLRILHAPADVGGNAFGLSRAERVLGHVSDVAVFAAGPYGYQADIRFDLEGQPVWRRFATRAAFLRRALRDYDVFHFNFGQPLLALRTHGHVFNELPLLKRAGKTVLVTFQGCDVRPQPYCHCTREECTRDTPFRVPNARAMLAHADRSFHLNPDLRRWLPTSEFTPYAHVDPRRVAAVPPPDREELVVLHAPTDRQVKGTDHVIAAVEELRTRGVNARLDLVEGVAHAEVGGRIDGADIVVDQLMIGWYGGFAVEAMARGRPVLAAIREDQPEDNPFGDELPIVRTGPDQLADDLIALAGDRERMRRTGAAGIAFVERHHDPIAIAERIVDGIAGSVRRTAV